MNSGTVEKFCNDFCDGNSFPDRGLICAPLGPRIFIIKDERPIIEFQMGYREMCSEQSVLHLLD